MAIGIDKSKTALLLMHWTNDVAAPGGKASEANVPRLAEKHIIEHTKAVLEASRKNGVPVIYVNACHRPGYPELPTKAAPMYKGLMKHQSHIKGSWGNQVIDELAPLENEIVVLNYSPSAFAFTELENILRNFGITDLVLSGLTTNWVVETTAREAMCRGYYVYSLEDCCMGKTDEAHQWSFANILPVVGEVITSSQYIDEISQ